MSPERKPGDPGWKPSDEDILAAQVPRPQFALRVFSVLPFILFGAFSVIALRLVDRGRDLRASAPIAGAVWQWAAGRGAGRSCRSSRWRSSSGWSRWASRSLSMWATLTRLQREPGALLLAVHRGRLRRRGARSGAGARAVAGGHGEHRFEGHGVVVRLCRRGVFDDHGALARAARSEDARGGG